MDKNTEYEKFTQSIYQKLLDESGLSVSTQHDVKIQGKAFKHQIDVFWEYQIAGVKNKVAIECKNYKKNISVGTIRDFHGVLKDIGNINGILVTKAGFQKGAKEYAEYYGINLIELREPKNEDWNNRAKIIKTTFEAIDIYLIDWTFVFDIEWGKAKFSEEEMKTIKFHIQGKNNEIWLLNSKNEKIKTLHQLEEELPVNDIITDDELDYSYEFIDAYVMSKNEGLVKVSKINYKYKIKSSKYKYEIDASKSVKMILKDVINNKITFIR